MRSINKIIVHCSATQEGKDLDAAEINRWHLKRGWNGIGYHYVVLLDGTIEYGRSIYKQGAHVKGENEHSIGICYIGGVDLDMNPKDTRTECQKESLVNLLTDLKDTYGGEVYGHRDFSKKDCPSFNAKKEYENISFRY